MNATAPTFAHGTRPGLVCSMLRSSGAAPCESKWDAGTVGLLPLWWGVSVAVHQGDRVRYFPTPLGIAFESVVRAGDP